MVEVIQLSILFRAKEKENNESRYETKADYAPDCTAHNYRNIVSGAACTARIGGREDRCRKRAESLCA